jgi:alkylation response protein AidB-like acyl-CoA dehydrogenase
MSTLQTEAVTLRDVADAVAGLVPTIAARADEIEAGRRIPVDLVDELVAAGCFRALLPRTHGGLDAELTDAMAVLEQLAGADASVAWTVMIGAGAWVDLAELPRATFDEVFAPEQDTIVAGVFSPNGSLTEAGDGFRVNGRWPFASGCLHATTFFGNCLVGVEDGVPQFRMAVFRPEQVVIEDTWHVSGLCGTGSHHVRADDVLVDREWTFRPMVDAPSVDSPYVRVPPPPLIGMIIGSVALGIARAAIDDIVAIAEPKVPLLSAGPLATNALFQFDLATADTTVRAARALLYETAAELWQTALAGDELTPDQRARFRAASTWVVDRAVDVTRAAFRAGGGSSVYLTCSLQRRLRDIDVLAQHFIVKRDTLTTVGAVLAGQGISTPIF